MMLQPAYHPDYQRFEIIGVREEAPEVKTLLLQPEQPLSYKAGQFLTLVFDEQAGSERRSYSFSSCPDTGEQPAITLRRVPNGRYSRPLTEQARVGDVLTSAGVAGRFVLPEAISELHQAWFFAAGIGITPVFSMIKALLHGHPHIEVILVYSNTSVREAVFYRQLLELHRQYPRQFRPEFLFSSSPDLSRARLSKWLFPQVLASYSRGVRSGQLFFTCGPFAYMRMVALSLEEAGYEPDQLKREIFDTKAPVFKPEPPDKKPHYVRLLLNGKEYKITVQYPQTILQAAKQSGIALPYSCETGRCSSCMMLCTEGRVWMANNEVLTEKDLRAGRVLTCVGYPQGGDVTLQG